MYGDVRAHCIFAGAADKDLTGVVELLSPLVSQWILPPVQSPRMMPPAELARLVGRVSDAPVNVPSTLAEALQCADRPLLICGSFFLLGEVLAQLQGCAGYRTTAQ